MGKPRLIVIVRHAQSEGNRDKTIHQHTPDHRVGLTSEGHEQAKEAGQKLRQLLRNDDTLHFFISPYRRTRETTEGILSTLCSNDPSPSPFQRSRIKVYEEPRLREQDFGNFQPGREETERLWRERASYGHFFYRIPNGESGADVYDRVSSFNGSLWRRFSEDSMASVAILVTHGLCSRIFLMAWYHYSVEFFEDLRNINHCEFLVMKLDSSGRYVLQNQLRRWSDLRKERAAKRSHSASAPSPEIPVRKWGSSRSNEQLAGRVGAMKGPQRQNTADLFKDPEEEERKPRPAQVPEEAVLDESKEEQITPKTDIKGLSSSSKRSEFLDYIHPSNLGRDGGGSQSGAVSPLDSPEESGESGDPSLTKEREKHIHGLFAPHSLAMALRGDFDEENRVMADALGDQSDADVDEIDLEVGTKDRQKRELAQILLNEKRERIREHHQH